MVLSKVFFFKICGALWIVRRYHHSSLLTHESFSFPWYASRFIASGAYHGGEKPPGIDGFPELKQKLWNFLTRVWKDHSKWSRCIRVIDSGRCEVQVSVIGRRLTVYGKQWICLYHECHIVYLWLEEACLSVETLCEVKDEYKFTVNCELWTVY